MRMDPSRLLTFVCVLWTVQLYDVCSAARSGGSSSKTGSSNVAPGSAGFVGSVDTSRPPFIIFMTIFGMCILAVIIFLIIMCCKIRRYCCFKLHGVLPDTTDKIHIVDSVNGSAHWRVASDQPQRKSPLPPLVVEDPAKKLTIPPFLKNINGDKPRARSPKSTGSLPPIYTLPYPVSSGTDCFTPPPEPELSGSYTESEFDSESESSTVEDGEADSVLSDRSHSQLVDYYPNSNKFKKLEEEMM